MSDELNKKLNWFLKNLNFLLEDYEFEKRGIKVDLYFDTYEVTELVLGLQAYYKAGGFNVEKPFRVEKGKPLRDRVLAICLAYNGKLGPIKVLAPHRAEFLSLLNKDFHIGEINVPPDQLVRQFLKAVSQTETIKQDRSSFEEMDDKKTLEYVRHRAGSAMDFFKILQLIRGVTWQNRLLSLRERRMMQFDSHDVDFDQIIHSEDFRKLRNEFDRSRPKFRPVANFADAVAVAILISELKRFKSGEAEAIPRFFAASDRVGDTPLFVTVVERSGLVEALSYKCFNENSSTALNEKSSGVLREADYFVFRSTFYSLSSDSLTDGQHIVGFREPEVLRELRDKILHILQGPTALVTREQVDEIIIAGRPLVDVIDDLNTFLFFTNVWMPSSAEEKELALEDLKQAADQLKSDAFRFEVDKGIKDARASIEKSVAEYQLISSLWEQVEDAVKSIRRHLQDNITRTVDYFRYFGLLRFAFPESAQRRINDVLETLLFGNREQEQATHYDVIAACYMAHVAPMEHIDNLAAATAVLWVAEMYEQLTTLLTRINPSPHFSLDLINAAAIFATNQDEQSGTKILNNLEQRCDNVDDVREKADLAVGIAYLYFHLWEHRGYGPAWDRPVGILPGAEESGREIIKEAIRFASEAYGLLGEWDIKKKVYALNQYLYYLVMGADDDQISKMNETADILLQYKEKDKDEWWQHRFDDTLARYFHRLAVSVDKQEEWNQYLSKAIEYSREAARQASWDKGINDYQSRLLIKKADGFKSHQMKPEGHPHE